MKLLFVLVSLFAAAQAQFSIGAPKAGTTLQAGQNVPVQIIVPIDTVSYMLPYDRIFIYWPIQSVEAGQVEVSLVIGIVACGTSACPAPSADLGEILFVGKFQSQGEIGTTLNSFENFTFTVPSDISGAASIQVQHVFLLTPPVNFFCCFTCIVNSFFCQGACSPWHRVYQCRSTGHFRRFWHGLQREHPPQRR